MKGHGLSGHNARFLFLRPGAVQCWCLHRDGVSMWLAWYAAFHTNHPPLKIGGSVGSRQHGRPGKYFDVFPTALSAAGGQHGRPWGQQKNDPSAPSAAGGHKKDLLTKAWLEGLIRIVIGSAWGAILGYCFFMSATLSRGGIIIYNAN